MIYHICFAIFLSAVIQICQLFHRDGTHELFEDFDKHKVPILIFSAGLGDCIISCLKHFKVMYPAVKVNIFHF